jgi:hypothetical protein
MLDRCHERDGVKSAGIAKAIGFFRGGNRSDFDKIYRRLHKPVISESRSYARVQQLQPITAKHAALKAALISSTNFASF